MTLTTVAGGQPGNSAILPLAGFIPASSVFTTTNPGNLDYAGGMLPFVSVLPISTTYRNIRVTFVSKQVLNLIGTMITLSATVADINGAFATPTSLTCSAASDWTGVISIGTTSTCTGAAPANLNDGGYIILSATATGLQLISNIKVDAAVSLAP